MAVRPKGAHTRTSLARKSYSALVLMSQTVPCVGRHEPGGPSPAGLARAFGGTRLGDGSVLVRTCVGGPEPDLRIYTWYYGGTMSASMCNKTFMSPEFLTRFLEEYRALPALWQVRSTEYSNWGKRVEAWDLLVHFSPFFSFLYRTHHIHLVLSPLLLLASMNSFWILNVRAKLGVSSCVCGEINPSPAPEASSPSRNREPDSYVYGPLKHELSSLA